MAFDGPLLTAAVVQAANGIPGCIQQIRDLIRDLRKEPSDQIKANGSEFEDYLDLLLDNLIGFCSVEAWLHEAKEAHTLLQRFDDDLSEPDRQGYAARSGSSRFDPQEFKMRDVQLSWKGIRNNHLPRIKAFATAIKHIEQKPLKLKADNSPEDGPDWIIRLFELFQDVEQLLKEYDDNGSSDVFLQVEASIGAVRHHVRYVMIKLDDRIQEEAKDMAQKMREIAASLKPMKRCQ